jgi:5'-nucleotidase
VQRWATEKPESGEAQIAFMNPGGLRSDMAGTLNAGVREVTYKGAAVVQPFANTLVNMDLSGAQIETVLEQQWQRLPDGNVPTRPFLRLGASEGFTYTYTETPVNVNGTATFQGEVTGMWLDGVPIDPAQVYSVTVNSFLGSGGDNFREFANGTGKADTGKVDLQAMVDYLDEFAASDPLPVDYSQRAVEVDFPAGAPAAYAPGDHVVFDIGSWAMTADGDQTDAELQVKLDDAVLDTAAVDNTRGTERYDSYGTASVDVTLPADLEEGTVTLALVGATTGTEIQVPIAILDGEPGPMVNDSPPTVTGTPRVGQSLTATAGTWTPTPASVSFQWFANGAPIAGATGPTLQLTGAQVGALITVGVTAHAAGFVDATAVSAQVTVKTKPKKIKVRKTKTKVVVAVTTPDGVAVTGTVKIKAKGQKAKTVAVVDGKAKVKLKAFTSTGAKRIKVSYLGSDLLLPATTVTTIWVVRR